MPNQTIASERLTIESCTVLTTPSSITPPFIQVKKDYFQDKLPTYLPYSGLYRNTEKGMANCISAGTLIVHGLIKNEHKPKTFILENLVIETDLELAKILSRASTIYGIVIKYGGFEFFSACDIKTNMRTSDIFSVAYLYCNSLFQKLIQEQLNEMVIDAKKKASYTQNYQLNEKRKLVAILKHIRVLNGTLRGLVMTSTPKTLEECLNADKVFNSLDIMFSEKLDNWYEAKALILLLDVCRKIGKSEVVLYVD